MVLSSCLYRTDGTVFEFSPKFIGMLGYHASLKTCLSGLALVKDISVTCFMRGGNLVDLVAAVMKVSKQQLAEDVRRGRKVDPEFVDLSELLKNAKIRIVHLNQSKKFNEFGE